MREIWSGYWHLPNIYNNFSWSNPDDKKKALIEKTAKAIFDARVLYPDYTLATLYDETMPSELSEAHRANDYAVMTADSFPRTITENERVDELMKRYRELTEGK